MTTEEKYNKALELARTYYNGGNEFLDTIFPELKESEDERIRRDIIHYILYKADGVSEEQEHSWIAYLEKQKEPLTPEEKMNHPLYLEGFDVGREVGAVVAKPAEWSDSFEENIRNLLHDKLTWHSDDGSISTTVFIDDKTIKDIVMGIWFYVGKEAMKNPNMELPKAEWSEEDADMLNCCISSIEEAKENRCAYKETDGDTSYDREIDWLKSLPLSLKKKNEDVAKLCSNEWSEEDEKKITFLERLIRYNVPEGQYGWVDGHKGGFATKLEAISMLKSLRPQSHWKPSEEQMHYLLAVINDPNNAGSESCHFVLQSLYAHLQKLL